MFFTSGERQDGNTDQKKIKAFHRLWKNYAGMGTECNKNSLPPVGTSHRSRLMHGDFAQPGAFRRELFPEPHGEIFKSRILQTLDFIQIPVIEPFHDLPRSLANLRMVVEPSHFWIDLPFHGNFHAKAVPVHPRAFVVGWDIRQCVSRFKTKILGQTNLHNLFLSNTTLHRLPDELVHLQLKPHIKLVLEDPVHDFHRLDSAEDWRK